MAIFLTGESEITKAHKTIDHVWVTRDASQDVPRAAPEVVEAILDADMIVYMGQVAYYVNLTQRRCASSDSVAV